MKPLLTSTLSSIADSVMELADSFGVFVFFYAERVSETNYFWQTGSFVRRDTHSTNRILLHLLLPDGRIGQAATSDCSLGAVETAFHQARNSASFKKGYLDLLHHLSVNEKRAAPPLTALQNNIAIQPRVLARSIEEHHMELVALTQPDLLDTTFQIRSEAHFFLRSDGSHDQMELTKAVCVHTLFSFERLQSYPFQNGITLSTDHSLSALIDPLKKSVTQWKTAKADILKPPRLPRRKR